MAIANDATPLMVAGHRAAGRHARSADEALSLGVEHREDDTGRLAVAAIEAANRYAIPGGDDASGRVALGFKGRAREVGIGETAEASWGRLITGASA